MEVNCESSFSGLRLQKCGFICPETVDAIKPDPVVHDEPVTSKPIDKSLTSENKYIQIVLGGCCLIWVTNSPVIMSMFVFVFLYALLKNLGKNKKSIFDTIMTDSYTRTIFRCVEFLSTIDAEKCTISGFEMFRNDGHFDTVVDKKICQIDLLWGSAC